MNTAYEEIVMGKMVNHNNHTEEELKALQQKCRSRLKTSIIVAVLLFPVAIASIVIYNIKFRNYRPGYRFPVLSSYAPVFSYIIAIAINTFILLARTNQVYALNAWIGLVVLLQLI